MVEKSVKLYLSFSRDKIGEAAKNRIKCIEDKLMSSLDAAKSLIDVIKDLEHNFKYKFEHYPAKFKMFRNDGNIDGIFEFKISYNHGVFSMESRYYLVLLISYRPDINDWTLKLYNTVPYLGKNMLKKLEDGIENLSELFTNMAKELEQVKKRYKDSLEVLKYFLKENIKPANYNKKMKVFFDRIFKIDRFKNKNTNNNRFKIKCDKRKYREVNVELNDINSGERFEICKSFDNLYITNNMNNFIKLCLYIGNGHFDGKEETGMIDIIKYKRDYIREAIKELNKIINDYENKGV